MPTGVGSGNINIGINFTVNEAAARRQLSAFDKAIGSIGKTARNAVSYVAGRLIYDSLRGMDQFVDSIGESIGEYERLGKVIRVAQAREIELASRGTEDAISLRQAYEQAGGGVQSYLNAVRSIALTRPVTEEHIADVFRTLAGYQLGTKRSMEFTKALADYSVTTGRTSEEVWRLSLAIGQIQAKGKLAGEEMRQLTNAGITQDLIIAGLNKLYPELGVNLGNFYDLMRSGDLKAGYVLPAMLDQLEQFEGLGKEVAKTWYGIPIMFGNISRVMKRTLFAPAFAELAKPIAAFIDMWDLDKHPGILRGMEAFGENIGRVFVRPMEWIAQRGVPTLERFFSGLAYGRSVIDKIGNAFQNAFQGFVMPTKEFSISSVFSILWEGLSESLAGIWNNKLAPVFTQWGQGALDWLKNLPFNITGYGEDAVRFLVDAWNSKIKPFFTIASTEATSWLKVRIDEVNAWGTEMGAALQQAWDTKIRPTIVKWGDDMWTWLAGKEGKQGQGIGGEGRTKIGDLLSELDKQLSSEFKEKAPFKTAGVAFVDALTGAAIDGAKTRDFSDFATAYREGITTYATGPAFKQSMQVIGRQLVEAMLPPEGATGVDAKPFLINTFYRVLDLATPAWTFISQGFASLATGIITQGLQRARGEESGREVVNYLDRTLSFGFDMVISNLVPVYRLKWTIDVIGQIIGWVQNPGALQAQSQEFISGMTGFLSEAWDAIVKNFKYSFGIRDEVWRDAMPFSPENAGAKAMFANVGVEIAKSIGDGLLKNGNALFASAKQLGNDLISGVWTGIATAATELEKVVKGAGNLVLRTLGITWQIESPSKVTYAMGQDLMIGAALGVYAGIPGLVAAIRVAGSQVTSSFGSYLYTPNWGGGPNITSWGGMGQGGFVNEQMTSFMDAMDRMSSDMSDLGGDMQDAALKIQTAADKLIEKFNIPLGGPGEAEQYGFDQSYVRMNFPQEYVNLFEGTDAELFVESMLGDQPDEFFKRIESVLKGSYDSVNKNDPLWPLVLDSLLGTQFEVPEKVRDVGGPALRSWIMMALAAATSGLIPEAFPVDPIVTNMSAALQTEERVMVLQQALINSITAQIAGTPFEQQLKNQGIELGNLIGNGFIEAKTGVNQFKTDTIQAVDDVSSHINQSHPTYTIKVEFEYSDGGGGGGGGGSNPNTISKETPGFGYLAQRGGTLWTRGAGSGDTIPFFAMLAPRERLTVMPRREVMTSGGGVSKVLNINIGSINTGMDEALLKHRVQQWAFEE